MQPGSPNRGPAPFAARDREAIFAAVWLTLASDAVVGSNEHRHLTALQRELQVSDAAAGQIEEAARERTLRVRIPTSATVRAALFRQVLRAIELDGVITDQEFRLIDRLIAKLRLDSALILRELGDMRRRLCGTADEAIPTRPAAARLENVNEALVEARSLARLFLNALIPVGVCYSLEVLKFLHDPPSGRFTTTPDPGTAVAGGIVTTAMWTLIPLLAIAEVKSWAIRGFVLLWFAFPVLLLGQMSGGSIFTWVQLAAMALNLVLAGLDRWYWVLVEYGSTCASILWFVMFYYGSIHQKPHFGLFVIGTQVLILSLVEVVAARDLAGGKQNTHSPPLGAYRYW